MSDAEQTSLLARLQAGDEQALAELADAYRTKIYQLAFRYLRSREDAEEVTQDVLFNVYRKVGEFRGDAALGTWLTRIVVNQALQALRRTRRDRVVVPFEESNAQHEALNVADSPDTGPENMLLRAQTRRLIERNIDALPEGYRTVFVLREVEDLTVEETAAALDIPAATVRTRLFRAKARLRESLAQQMDVATQDAFGFDGERCDRIVRTVLDRIEAGLMHPTELVPRK